MDRDNVMCRVLVLPRLTRYKKNFDWMNSQQKMVALFPNLRTIIVNKCNEDVIICTRHV